MTSSSETKDARRMLGIPVEENFNDRAQRRINFLRRAREFGKELGASYEQRDGDYARSGLVRYDWDKGKSEYVSDRNYREDESELLDTELFLERYLEKLLIVKRDSLPVVALDIGGMMGQTWNRLANRFKNEVANSEIVFIVSNIAYYPEEHLEDEVRKRYWSSSKDMKKVGQFLKNGRKNLLYVNADVSRLRRAIIKLPNGSTLPLRRGVDLVHESFSLHYWSHVPELEILQAATLLSEYGIYIIQRGDHWTGVYGDEPHLDWGVRADGIKLAHEELETRFGLRKITHVEQGSFQGGEIMPWMFRKPNAPAVKVDVKHPERIKA